MLFADTVADTAVSAHDHAVRVRFSGPLRGFVELRATHDVIVAAAMNMLGEEAPLSPEMELDAFGEVANVICGNLLPGISGADRVFRLEAPVRADVHHELFADASVDMMIEGGHVQVMLVVEEAVEGEAA